MVETPEGKAAETHEGKAAETLDGEAENARCVLHVRAKHNMDWRSSMQQKHCLLEQ